MSTILDRYARTPDNKVVIDIDAEKIEDLYNNFDRQSPYIKKELDQNLVEYLIDSVREIDTKEFIIRFRFTTGATSSLTERIPKSIHNYFRYLTELERRKLTRMIRTSLILLCFGALVLALSMWGNDKLVHRQTIFSHVITEGLTVAAWVALWNGLATFIINWMPHRSRLRIYQRIIAAPVHFQDKG
ncbi:MAG: hypothetical protein C0613_06630 [Desulfobulbaceae bacterium]|nr:MAG: hypothetical protein C0613_06630 [Desulfobulbaceae bacterium]